MKDGVRENYCLSLGEIFTDEGGLGFQWASDLAERNKLWKARHNCLYAAMNLRPGTKVYFFIMGSGRYYYSQRQWVLCAYGAFTCGDSILQIFSACLY